MNRLRNLWQDLRSSLWFVPALIVLGAVILAAALIDLDGLSNRARLTEYWPRLFGAGAEGSRGLLSAIASSMITVAGVTFSITVVALALASSQYTSRILANFMGDRANQTVLGVFLGVFAYCLVVLRTIRGGSDGVFVPALAVLGAVILAFVAIGFLIFFIHHIADSIQATSIIETTANETLQAIDRLFPAELGKPVPERDQIGSSLLEATWVAIPAVRTGYLQRIDGDALFSVARAYDTVIRMERAIGDFVIRDAAIAWVADRPGDDARLVERVNGAYTVGRRRTVYQDAAYGIRQIVDVALKALSPGINDTTTAINCIDYLGAILTRVAQRRIAQSDRSDGKQLRVIARGSTFEDLLAESFDQIRQNSAGNVAVLVRVLETLTTIGARALNDERRLALRVQGALVFEMANQTVVSPHDRAVIDGARNRLFNGHVAGAAPEAAQEDRGR